MINGLTDETHPLHALADAMTLRERFGTLEGIRLAYVGVGNNVCSSLMRMAGRFGWSSPRRRRPATSLTKPSSPPQTRMHVPTAAASA